jgi:3-phosphoshikimate 1-carboxyvinyltransferase
LKECDRLEATYDLLTRFGVRAEKTEDSLLIYGEAKEAGEPVFQACEIDSYDDHRIVMAAAIAATRAEGPVRIKGYRAIDKSYPMFFRDFRRMGGKADEFDMGE